MDWINLAQDRDQWRAVMNTVMTPASHLGGPGSNPGLVMWDFVMDKSGAGAGFLRELLFPLPIYIPSGSPQPSHYHPRLAQ
jgi:hypothetical protein